MRSTTWPTLVPTSGSFRSCPAQKPRPAPVITRQRTPASLAAASSAARSSRCIADVKLLSNAGRLSVSLRTASVVSIRTSGSVIVASLVSLPDFARGLHHQLELAPLVFHRDVVAVHGA